jgi:hypothetical protein
VKYGEGKYGSFLYGVAGAIIIYIRAAIRHPLAIAASVKNAIRARVSIRPPIEVKI